jgi:glyoxylase-like metal-dependent hydrolase (beta-lactamase superfamily II)
MTLAHPAYGQLRQVTPTAAVLLANNPGQMTLDGTNTWILRAPGHSEFVVVDPGPRDRSHSQAIASLGPVALTLITHRHGDHTGGLKRHVMLTGSQVRSADPGFLHSSMHPLRDGEIIDAAGLRIRVLATPGHTADSVSFVLEDAVLTGDTILGKGTAVLDPNDGSLGAYLDSLNKLVVLGAGRKLLPAHGPERDDTATEARDYIAHRMSRLEQVQDALLYLGENASASKIVAYVYRNVDKRLWPAARASVKAQLTYLREHPELGRKMQENGPLKPWRD